MSNKYKESKFRTAYESIADEVDSTPERVYDLAHGARAESHEDSVILDMLEKHHIISVHTSKQKKVRKRIHKVDYSQRIYWALLIIFAIAFAVAYFLPN